MDLDAVANDIAQKAMTIKNQNPTEDQLREFIVKNTSDPPDVSKQTTGDAARFALREFPAQTALPKAQVFLDRWKDAIHKAVCVDFNYCKRKATVDADLKKYLPEIVKALIGNKVGWSGPSWLVSILSALGFSAGWEAAVATIVAYLLIIGLDKYCGC